MVAHNRNKF